MRDGKGDCTRRGNNGVCITHANRNGEGNFALRKTGVKVNYYSRMRALPHQMADGARRKMVMHDGEIVGAKATPESVGAKRVLHSRRPVNRAGLSAGSLKVLDEWP